MGVVSARIGVRPKLIGEATECPLRVLICFHQLRLAQHILETGCSLARPYPESHEVRKVGKTALRLREPQNTDIKISDLSA